MKQRHFALGLLCLSLLLSACVSPPPPKEVYYRFEALPAPARASKPITGKLRVASLRAQGVLSERALLFSHSATPGKLEQYRYHHWAKPPAQLLTEDLLLYLQQAGVARQVLDSDTRSEPGVEIGGELLRLERIVGDGKDHVNVEILLRAQHYRSRDLLLRRRYAESFDIPQDSMVATTQAMSLARQRIFERFLADLRKL